MERITLTHISRTAVLIGALSWAVSSQALTTTFNQNIETDPTNRPFFSQAAFPSIANDRGWVGSAVPGTSNSSMVSNVHAGVGGNDSNGVPLGVGIDFQASFNIQAVNPAHLLSDAGANAGLAVSSGGSDAANRVNAGEKLRFSNVQVSNYTVHDPLGLLQPGATIGVPLWRLLRSNTDNLANSPTVTVSSDEAGTVGVANFTPTPPGPGPGIYNDTPGILSSPITPMYVNTTAGSWAFKAVGFQVELTYDLAPVPASRRTFKFGDPEPRVYDGLANHQIVSGDTTINLAAVGDTALLDTNDNGVGVDSGLDSGTGTMQRFIDGSLATPEAINFSFDRDVSLESLTLGNLELNNSESVVLQFVSGVNPFTGLTGYTGDYSLTANSLTYKTNAGGQTPYAIVYGKNGQSEVLIEAGTVLSLSANPAVGGGFLLDMLTVNVPSVAPPDANFDDDGDVDEDDLDIWADNFGSTSATETTGDADNDDDADGADFLQWQREFTGPAVANVVPEPGNLALLAVGGAALRLKRRRPERAEL